MMVEGITLVFSMFGSSLVYLDYYVLCVELYFVYLVCIFFASF